MKNTDVPFTLGNLVDMGVDGMEATRAVAVINGLRAKIDGAQCGRCHRPMYAVVTTESHADPSRLRADATTHLCDACRSGATAQ